MSRLCGVSTNAGHIHSDGTSGQVLTASLKLGTRLEHLHSCCFRFWGTANISTYRPGREDPGLPEASSFPELQESRENSGLFKRPNCHRAVLL
jgi:hypothetical protein